MIDSFTIRVDGITSFEQFVASLPQRANSALQEVLQTVLPEIQRRTPVGIRYVPFGDNKKGEPITKAGKLGKRSPAGLEGFAGKRYRGKWVASGILKAAWTGEVSGNVLSISNSTAYGGILESGAYSGIGKFRVGIMPGGLGQVSPRTISTDGGIFSSRAPGGIVGPMVTDENMLNRIVNTVVREIQRGIT